MKALYDVDIEPGKSILACMTVEEDRIEAKRNLDRALQGEQFVEAAYSGDEGLSRKYFEVTHSPIRNELGEVTGVAVFSSDQTESKQAEDALRKSEEYFRLLFDNAGEAIFACDSELIMTDINRIGCELIGYGREELVGNNILELGILHPDDMENASTAIRRLFDGEDRIETESTFIRKDGATRLAVVTGAAIRDPDGSLRSFIDICHDITEERRVEEALRQTSDYLESLLDYANAPIIVWDNEFKVRRFNYAFERFTGYAADEVTNGTPNILFPVETREESLGRIERTLSGEHWESVEIPILRKDGDTRIALWNSANIYDKDGKTIIATIAQGQDITERKKAEESIKKNSEELKDLIEIAAHELRHPATVFRGYAQILMANWEDLDRGTIQDALCRIDEATNRLMRLVISLLETSHIERGKMDLSLSEVDPVAPVRLAIEEFRSRELDRELRLTCAGFDNEEMDAEKVKQVLEILIDNAVKYSDKECPVDIECEKGEGEIVYRVADLGPGIPDEDRERIFERFYQVGDVLHHSVHGIGLGLYIAKAIVEVHGGWISEEPRDGGGSVFSFGIPAVRESDHVQDGSHMGVAG